MQKMDLNLRIYTNSIIILGFCLLGIGIINYDQTTKMINILFFAILAVITESSSIKLKEDTALSVVFAIGLATVLIFDPFVASIITFFGILCRVEYDKEKGFSIFKHSIFKDLFNGCAYSICAGISGLVYSFSFQYFPLMLNKINIAGTILATLIYVLINSLIYILLMTIIEKGSFKEVLTSHFWAIRNMLAIAPLGVIIALAFLNFGKFAVILFFVPLLLARYSFKLYMDMRHIYFETIKALSNAMEAKDKYTNGHSYRVADYAVGIADQMNLSSNRVDQVRTAAILHDIGKIGIADAILNKTGRLEDNEYLAIQQHPQIGAKILSEVDFLTEVANIIKYHHERYDGKGYPEGLTDSRIPIEASILAVADAYDAMTSDRPYRKAMDSSVAMKILFKESGTQFNPIVVRAFQEYLNSKKIEVISNVS